MPRLAVGSPGLKACHDARNGLRARRLAPSAPSPAAPGLFGGVGGGKVHIPKLTWSFEQESGRAQHRIASGKARRGKAGSVLLPEDLTEEQSFEWMGLRRLGAVSAIG